jgi:hypothetical protein
MADAITSTAGIWSLCTRHGSIGPPIVVSAAHAKIRRDGYRKSCGQ